MSVTSPLDLSNFNEAQTDAGGVGSSDEERRLEIHELRQQWAQTHRQVFGTRAARREEIAAHRAAGHMIFMVSDSPQEIVLPLSRYLGADGAVATIAETDRAGKYTGNVEFYSYGPYKADAIEALALEHDLDLDESYAYTDSITDLPMLETIGHPIVVNPDKALNKIATDRGWEVRWFSNTVPLRARVTEHARTGAVVAGMGMLAGGAGWYVRSRRPRRLRTAAPSSWKRF